jgi:acyl-CoA synthetase (NDP forming)
MIDAGLPAENPLDVGATNVRRADNYAAICKLVAADLGVDMLALQGQLPTLPEENPDPALLAGIAAATDKPVVVFGRMAQNVSEAGRDYQRRTGLPFVQGLPAAIRAMQALAQFAERSGGAIPALPAPSANRERLTNAAFLAMLRHHGIALPRSSMAKSPEEAALHAAKITFPVALKIVSPEASHKTEVGGVAVDLPNPPAVLAAAQDMQARLFAKIPKARTAQFLVQKMVSGLEFFVGIRTDPLYGPFLVLGLGGILVEVLKDTAIALLPVDEAQVRAMLASLRSAPLLGEFRGQPARDVDALVRAVLGLAKLFLDHREQLSDVEINPLMVGRKGEGACAVDLRIVRHARN